MLRKNYYTFLLAVALFLVGGISAFAQTALVRGKVMMKQADGTSVPVADAVVDVYRIDIVGKPPAAKTKKNGEFIFAGLLSGGKYALAVSAPNITPKIAPDIKAGDEGVMITVVAGDGKRLTEEEVRQALVASTPENQTTELTAKQKEEQAELIKKNEQIVASNKKVENAIAVTNRAIEEGNKAFNAKNYDEAIARYEEGINADPDFAGTASYLLNGKSMSLIERSIIKYNAAIKGDPNNMKTAMESIKKDLNDAVAASSRALELLKGDTQTDATAQKRALTVKNTAYANLLDGYGRMLAMNIDATKGKDALAILEQYSVSETDPVQKTKTHLVLADSLSRSGDLANAVVVYRKVLGASPDNPDALGGLGLSLVGLGSSATPPNTAMMQEGLNLMQRFTEIAPDNHPLKASVKDAVDYLKTQQLTPQKTKTTTKKKP